MQALTRWQHPVALSEAQDVIHLAMCPTLHRRIPTSDLPAFFIVVNPM
jgi:hypothetical protein